jgi:hypothetical protein
MNKIFIEAENKTTPEYNFLKAFVNSHFPDKKIEFTSRRLGRLLFYRIKFS